jgi:hypothetical protein
MGLRVSGWFMGLDMGWMKLRLRQQTVRVLNLRLRGGQPVDSVVLHVVFELAF